MNEHEQGLLAFLEDNDRRRLSALLSREGSGRQKVRDRMDHAIRLAPEHCERLTGHRRAVGAVEIELRRWGASDYCHVLSANSEIDGRDLPLAEALVAVIGGGHGAFVSCLPGRLGLYEYEDAGSTFLLRR